MLKVIMTLIININHIHTLTDSIKTMFPSLVLQIAGYNITNLMYHRNIERYTQALLEYCSHVHPHLSVTLNTDVHDNHNVPLTNIKHTVHTSSSCFGYYTIYLKQAAMANGSYHHRICSQMESVYAKV